MLVMFLIEQESVQVRQDWGLKGTVGISGWQNIMRQYLKQEEAQAKVLLGAPKELDLDLLSEDRDVGTDSTAGVNRPFADSATNTCEQVIE